MNKELKTLYDWLDEPKQLTRQIIKDKIIEIDSLIKPKVVRQIFTPPTVDEISEYCKLRNNNLDAEYIFDFYESKNWFVGKNKMVDWKASVRTWEKNNINNPKTTKNESRREPLFGRQTIDTVKSNASGWGQAI